MILDNHDMPKPLNKSKYRKDIQYLRGIAVSAVVLFHANESYFPNGYLGVDVFFVISGFVVTPLILRIFEGQDNSLSKIANLKAFYLKRYYRLAPALAFVLFLSTLLIFFLGPVGDHKRYAMQGFATIFLLGNFGAYKYSGDYFSPNPNPLVHTWSLSVEEQIYIFFPLLMMFLILKNGRLRKGSITLLSLIAITSLSLFIISDNLGPIFSKIGIQSPSEFSFYSPFNRLWEFYLGGFCQLISKKNPRLKWKTFKYIDYVMLISFTLILFGAIRLDSKLAIIMTTSISATTLIFKSLELVTKNLMKVLEWIGDRSYSIYLIHMPLLYLAKYSPISLFGNQENRGFSSVIAVVTSLIIGSLSYSMIENKFRYISELSKSKFRKVKYSLIFTLLLPSIMMAGMERSSALEIKNSGLPVPSRVVPWDWDKKCQILSSESNVNPAPCKYGNFEYGKSILLIGDSHAASISRAIITLGIKNQMNIYVFTYSGCGFVLSPKDSLSSYSYPYLTPDCMKHNRSILNKVKKIKPLIVIYNHRSSSIMISPNNIYSRTLYNKMIAKNLEILKSENIKLIHIGSVPELIPIQTRFQDWYSSAVRFSEIPFQENFFWKDNKVADFYLNTIEIFCKDGVCKNNSSDGWLYHDADHLSYLGSTKLIPPLDSLLKKVLMQEVKKVNFKH
jgi:peptidoglycan/LPS O-acetylase OafA/YrhL